MSPTAVPGFERYDGAPQAPLSDPGPPFGAILFINTNVTHRPRCSQVRCAFRSYMPVTGLKFAISMPRPVATNPAAWEPASEGHRGILKLPSLADPASQLARHLA